MGEDFRSFLKDTEETQEGGFIRITEEVDTRYVSAIVTKRERENERA